MDRSVVSYLLPPVEFSGQNPFSRPVVAAGLMLGLFVLLLAGWLALAPISGAVVIQGTIKVDMNRRTLQHQEGGIVRQLMVRDGQHVKAGQPLLVLQDLRTDANADFTQAQFDAELIHSARLGAEKLLAESIAYPPEILSRRGDPRIRKQLEREEYLFQTRRQALTQQVAILEQQAEQSRDEATALKLKIQAENESLQLQRDELKANENLVDKGFVASTRIMGFKRAVTEYEARFRNDQAEFSATEQKASDLRFRVAALKNRFTENAAAELKDASAKLLELEERLRPLRDAANRLTVNAPVDGEIVGLRVNATGVVVGPRDALMDLVPDAAKLIVEARVAPGDAQQVMTKAMADVRLVGYKTRITPTVRGVVTYLSSDRLVERTGSGESPYFLTHIEIDKAELEKAGGLELRAGMAAEVYIRTVERTPLEYLFDPLTAFFGRGLREM